MKKGQKIIGISGIILAISMASIACQKNTETEKVVENETRTTLEYVETLEKEESESDKETEKKETKTEKKETGDKKKKTSETKETKETDKKSDSNKKETEGKETSKKESETKPVETKPQRPSKPAETQPEKPAETKPSKPAETKPVEPQRPSKPEKPAETQHNHTWVEQTQIVVVEEAWDEPIYKATNICSVCQIDLGSTDNAIIHSVETGHSYYVGDFQVGTKHHDAVTKKEVIGYKCSSCGETK